MWVGHADHASLQYQILRKIGFISFYEPKIVMMKTKYISNDFTVHLKYMNENK